MHVYIDQPEAETGFKFLSQEASLSVDSRMWILANHTYPRWIWTILVQIGLRLEVIQDLPLFCPKYSPFTFLTLLSFHVFLAIPFLSPHPAQMILPLPLGLHSNATSSIRASPIPAENKGSFLRAPRFPNTVLVR